MLSVSLSVSTISISISFLVPKTLIVIHASLSNSQSLQELDDMKKRLKEMEDEAAALREMQAKVEKEMGSVQGDSFLGVGDC